MGTMKKVWLKRIHLSMNGETIGFCPQTCFIKNHIMQKYIVLLKRFHLNGNTNGFHPQTQKLELRSTYIIVPCKSTDEEVPVVIECSHHRISSTGTKVTTTVTN